MITKDKVIEIFCIIDEIDKHLSDELSKNLRLRSVDKAGIRRRNRPVRMSESEIMTVLVGDKIHNPYNKMIFCIL